MSLQEEIRTQRQTEGGPCEDTGRRQSSTSQGEKAQEKQNLPHLDFGLSGTRTVRK